MRTSRTMVGDNIMGILLTVWVMPVVADTHHVSVPQSIQAAIEATENGDVIEVAPGIYSEAIDFKGKEIRLYSSAGPDMTTIDGGGALHVVQCISGEGPGTILDGFTITGGNATGYSIGGGMYNLQSSSTVINCTFRGNLAGFGGGMGNRDSSPTVANCTFSGNHSSGFGGGMYNQDSSPIVTNCMFRENWAPMWGGGMYNESGGPTVTNCTFGKNYASEGGGMFNVSSNATVTNCILWGNTANQGPQIGGWEVSKIAVTYSNVQGGWPGAKNIDSDPLFVNVARGNLRLSPGSLCIDAGNDAAVPEGIATDLDGTPRIVDGNRDGTAVVDMGAYEMEITAFPHNVTKDYFYPTIQAAINDADKGNEIEVPPGTYYEAVNFFGKSVRLYSSGGCEVTTMDGTGHYHVVQCVSGEGAGTILEGFTITGGNANGTSVSDRIGGGMYNESSSPTVRDCLFFFNSASDGGGMYNHYQSSPAVTNCTFCGNSANSGGGMDNSSSNPTITGCTFSGNLAEFGGGMYNFSSSPVVTGCIFRDNSATRFGGGMRNYNSLAAVTNCIFSGNSAGWSGGGMDNVSSSNPTVTGCTFSGNSAPQGGGMRNYTSNPVVTNGIVWGNSPDQFYNYTGSPVVTYSAIQGGTGQSWFGKGCIDIDPCFVDVTSQNTQFWNLRLKPGSPCIDAGDNAGVPVGITTDLGGQPRFIDSCKADMGSGTAPIVDMGAYEFLPGDLDGNGLVNMQDYGLFATKWLQISCDTCDGADMTCDGDVDCGDLLKFAESWLIER